jgi:anti-sigma-K factor RskA
MNATLPESGERLGRALGALDDDEAAVFEDTLARSLALLGPSVEPSAELRAAIFAQLDSAPTASAGASPADAFVTSTSRASARPPRSSASSGPRASRSARSPRSRARRIVGAVAGFAAALAIVAGGLGIVHGLQSPQQSGVTKALATVQAASDEQTVTARFHSGAAKVTIIASASLGKSVAVVGGAPAVPADRTYELWYIRGTRAIPAGLFKPSSSGTATVALTGKYRTGDVIAATVEPKAGSAQPTSTPVFELQS